MSDPENFLSRWSRRKREPEAEVPKPPAAAAPESTAEDGEAGDTPVAAANAQPSAEPAFDPASLPPLDSITAESDISAFLKANVPSPLRLAALRRAWSADPAIRDFKGLADYDWDFTAPDSMRGFGNLESGTDVKKMLTQIFGEIPRTQEAAAQVPNAPEQIVQPQQESSGPAELTMEPAPPATVEDQSSTRNQSAENKVMLQREEVIAAQDKKTESDDSPIKRRRSQGSALPQ